jgi:opacity protein-like surface antigen
MIDLIGRALTTVLAGMLIVHGVIPTAAMAAPEWFADVYLGVAATHSTEADKTVSGQTTREDAGGETSVDAGVRVGRWFETLPWLGLALDSSYFKPGPDSQTIPASLLVMGRLAFLKGGDFPDGRLRPYAGVGPGVFVTLLDGELASVEIGLNVRAGALFRLNEKIAIFGEYGFTYVSPSLDSDKTDTKIEATFSTHHVVGGISFRF